MLESRSQRTVSRTGCGAPNIAFIEVSQYSQPPEMTVSQP